MLDDLLVGARGARVRCTECGTVFRVLPASSNLAELGAALPDELWRVTQPHGGTLHFASVSELSRAILAGQVESNDVLSHGMLPARRLGEVLELTSFFTRAHKPPADDRIPTLPGLVDPAQRAAVERARAAIERLHQEAAARTVEAAAPPTDPTPPPAMELPGVATYAMTPDEGTPVPYAESYATPPVLEPVDSSSRLLSSVPEAAISPPLLPPVDDPTEPDLHDALQPLRRTYAERMQHARKARLLTGVVSLLATAALVLVAGLGVQALRGREARSVARSAPVATPPVLVARVPPPVASSAAPVSVQSADAPSVVPSAVIAVAASSAAAAEYHRGDPEHLPAVDPRRMVADGAHALRHGALGKAESAFRHALDKNPYDSEALSGLADLARVRGQHDKARELYAQALSVNPNYLPALLALADLAWAAGDQAEARKGYEHIVGHYPTSAYPSRVKKRVEEAAP